MVDYRVGTNNQSENRLKTSLSRHIIWFFTELLPYIFQKNNQIVRKKFGKNWKKPCSISPQPGFSLQTRTVTTTQTRITRAVTTSFNDVTSSVFWEERGEGPWDKYNLVVKRGGCNNSAMCIHTMNLCTFK